MSRLRLFFIAAAGVLLIAGPASSRADGRLLTIEEGVGIETCAQYGQQYASDPNENDDVAFGWLNGYITGLNDLFAVQHRQQFDWSLPGNGPQDQITFLHSFCNANPLAEVSDAAWAMITASRGNNGELPPY